MSLALLTLNAPLLSNRKYWDNALQTDKKKKLNRIRCSKRQEKQDVTYVLDLLYPPEQSTTLVTYNEDEIVNIPNILSTPYDEVDSNLKVPDFSGIEYIESELDIDREIDNCVCHDTDEVQEEHYLDGSFADDENSLYDNDQSDDETTICSNVSKSTMKKVPEDISLPHPTSSSEQISKGHSSKEFVCDLAQEERDPIEDGLVRPIDKVDSSMSITVYSNLDITNNDDLNDKLEQLENMWTDAFITKETHLQERDLESIAEEDESMMSGEGTRRSEQETIDEVDEEEEEGSICSQMETSSIDEDEEGSMCSQASSHEEDDEGSICSQASLHEEDEEGSICSQARCQDNEETVSVSGDLSFGPEVEDDPSSVLYDDYHNSVTVGSSALSGSSWSDEYEKVLLNGIPKDLAISKKVFRNVPPCAAVSDCSSSSANDSQSEASKEPLHLQRYTSRSEFSEESRQLPSSEDGSRHLPSDEDSVSVSLSVVSVSSGSFSSSCYSIELMDLKARKIAIQRRFQSIGVPLCVSLSSKESHSKGSSRNKNLVADFISNRKWNEQYRNAFKDKPMDISNRRVFGNGIPMDVSIGEASVSSMSWHQSGDDADSVSSASMSSASMSSAYTKSASGSASVSSSSLSSVSSNHSSGILDLKARKREIERRVQSIEMLLGRSKSSPYS